MVMETGCLSQAALSDDSDPTAIFVCPLIVKDDFVQEDALHVPSLPVYG